MGSCTSKLPADKRREMDAFWQQKALVLVQLLNDISVVASLLVSSLSRVCFPPAPLATPLEASEASEGF